MAVTMATSTQSDFITAVWAKVIAFPAGRTACVTSQDSKPPPRRRLPILDNSPPGKASHRPRQGQHFLAAILVHSYFAVWALTTSPTMSALRS
jgi:hypothetical protein